MKRRELREQIFQLLFRIEFHEEAEMSNQMKLFFEDIEKVVIGETDKAYIGDKFLNICTKLPEIDSIINQIAEGWKTNRMSKVDLTIIRLAVYEMKFDDEVPVNVAINEAVELAKKFGGDDSSAFVNGILAKLA
ncbi:transcription antitermination factor NusB [Lachnotalea glycerini]|uniref:Transcription antitermination protein NusB n=2 Tax=Lachnotalea glycerini TaxID=1763509 RepID=A0A371JIG6_9FIRM|nr:transcription antitermination factor NusB [Lachnotalea glycerini]RDY32519.1 transcription antitermination factor NusB [Lachnotalea glycerini]